MNSMKRPVFPVILIAFLFTSILPTYAASAELNYADSRYTADESGEYTNVPAEYTDEISQIPDESFFGVWKGGKWMTEPLLDYGYSSALASVEALAKAGKYKEAKEALLQYYRDVKATRSVPVYTALSAGHRSIAALYENNIHNTGGTYLGTMYLSGTAMRQELDITSGISSLLTHSNSKATLYIIAEKKTDNIAQIDSRSVKGNEPVLELIIDGEKKIFTAASDSTIRAGSYKDTVYNEDKLYVSESSSSINVMTNSNLDMNYLYEPMPVDSGTYRTLLQFDLSTVKPGTDISSATLSLYGKNSTNTDEMGLVVFAYDCTWTEENICWNQIEHGIVSFQGEPYVRYNFWQSERFSTQNRTDRQRFHYLSPIVTAYLYTGDEKYAKIALTQVCGILDQLATQPALFSGQSSTLDDPDGLISGLTMRNNLDVRSPGMCAEPMTYLLDSPHMTAEIWTAWLKYSWRTADHLSRYYTSSNNWGSYETEGYFRINVYFPEFKKTQEWREIILSRLYNAGLMAPDGSSLEASLTYVGSAVSPLYNMQNLANSLGLGTILDDASVEQIVKSYKYRSYSTAPGFLDNQRGDATGGTYRAPSAMGKLFDSPELTWCHEQILGTPPVFTSHAYPIGTKEYIMRTGWHKNDLYLYTNMNAGWGSHAHADDLQVVVFAYGENLLTDQAYLGDNSSHEGAGWVKNTVGHNTVLVNDTNQSKTAAVKRDYNDNPNITENWVTNSAYDYFRGTIDTNADAKHTRSIFFIKDKYWIVNDYLVPNGTRTNNYKQLWHMQPDSGMYIDPTDNSTNSDFKSANISVIPVNASEYTGITVKDGWYRGTGNGSAAVAPYSEYEISSAENVSFETVLMPEDAASDISVSTQRLSVDGISGYGAVAMNIDAADALNPSDAFSASYYNMNDTSQRKTVTFGDYSFDGTLAYIEKNKDGELTKIDVQDETEQASGITLTDASAGTVLFKSTSATPSVAIELSGQDIYIYSHTEIDPMANTLFYSGIPHKDMTIYAPNKINRVYLNGTQISFNRNGRYIYFGSAPIIQDYFELAGHWAENEILYLIEKDIVLGAVGSLNLSGSLTRAEFAAMLLRSLPLESEGDYTVAKDVTADDWYASVIGAANAAGIMQGSDGYFRPNIHITREEMAAMLMRAISAVYPDYDASRDAPAFTDSESVSAWAQGFVGEAASLGFVIGFEDGAFLPQNIVPREQAMMVIYRIMHFLN